KDESQRQDEQDREIDVRRHRKHRFQLAAEAQQKLEGERHQNRVAEPAAQQKQQRRQRDESQRPSPMPRRQPRRKEPDRLEQQKRYGQHDAAGDGQLDAAEKRLLRRQKHQL